jgi:hypothetical protein
MTRVAEIPETKPSWGLAALDEVRSARRQHQDSTAAERGRWLDSNRYFYGRVKQLLQFIVEPGSRVLELRCLRGDTLAELQASRGVGRRDWRGDGWSGAGEISGAGVCPLRS